MKNELIRLREILQNIYKLKTEKIVAYTAILGSISTVIIMILTLISIRSSIKQFTLSNKNAIKQTELLRQQIEDNKTIAYSQLPANITLDPEYMVNSENGNFIIRIINNNLYDLTSLGVIKNCYQAGWEDEGLTGFTVNGLSTIPNKILDTLRKGESYEFKIERNYLKEAIVNPPKHNQHANFLKLEFSYQRIIDKKTFSTSKLYLLTPNNTTTPETLIDQKEDTKIKFGSVTFKEIKEYLGVKTDQVDI